MITTHGNTRGRRKIRYAVVGLGHIAQTQVLPAFASAQKNSSLTALVSDDSAKLSKLTRQYGVPFEYEYRDFDACLASGNVDAVYIALPNSQHREFAIRAARAGVHVLCEKPLALDESECHEIIRACSLNQVHLMTAYRLHFERANLEAIRVIQSGRIGEPRIFNSLFTMQIKEGNIRLQKALGGGTLYDIGIYCINAARYLFQSEPTSGIAFAASCDDRRFKEVDEMTSAMLHFPEKRIATFNTSFGAADCASYDVVGTRGVLRMEQAYEHSESIQMRITVKGRTKSKEYARRDQFAPELVYFSDCILRGRPPEPSGEEGLRDVHIIRSLLESIETGDQVRFQKGASKARPTLKQEIFRPAKPEATTIHVSAPSKD